LLSFMRLLCGTRINVGSIKSPNERANERATYGGRRSEKSILTIRFYANFNVISCRHHVAALLAALLGERDEARRKLTTTTG